MCKIIELSGFWNLWNIQNMGCKELWIIESNRRWSFVLLASSQYCGLCFPAIPGFFRPNMGERLETLLPAKGEKVYCGQLKCAPVKKTCFTAMRWWHVGSMSPASRSVTFPIRFADLWRIRYWKLGAHGTQSFLINWTGVDCHFKLSTLTYIPKYGSAEILWIKRDFEIRVQIDEVLRCFNHVRHPR